MSLNPYERTIIDVLKRSDRGLTIDEIAGFGKMTWSTAKKYLETLQEDKKIVKDQGKWYLSSGI